MKGSSRVNRRGLVVGFVLLFLFSILHVSLVTAQSAKRLPLDEAVVLVDSSEASYVQYGAKDLGSYLTEITGRPVTVSTSANAGQKAKSIIAVGETMALAMGADLGAASELGDDGSVIRSLQKGGARVVVVAGRNPHGTNTGVATLMQMIRTQGRSPYLEDPL